MTAVMKPATAADVARTAGVSRTTVSRILRGDEAAFPPATRRRVHEAASQLEYRPSIAGRSLVSGRSDMIVVLIPNMPFGSNLQEAVDEIIRQTQPYGANVVVRFASATVDATVEALRALRPMGVLNMGVLDTGLVSSLNERGLVVVPDAEVSQARPGGGIAALQVDRLREWGDGQVWYVGLVSERGDPFSESRFVDLREHCRTTGMDEPRQIDVRPELADGVRVLQRVLSHDGRALLACYNDEAALTMLAAARELSVTVPDEVAVIGVDATTAGQLWSPRLTTIAVDVHGLVAGLAAQLARRLGLGWKLPTGPWQEIAELVPGQTA